MKLDKLITYILIITILIATTAVIYIIVNPSPSEKYTEFYILGPNGMAGDYPVNLTTSENGSLTIGVVNHEDASVNYQLTVTLANNTLMNQSFTLSNGEKTEIPFTFQPTQSGDGQKLEFNLYKLPNTQQPYRNLFLVINVS